MKRDALMFIVGVVLGLFAFGEFVPVIWQWYSGSGALGRYTLADWLGIDHGLIAAGMTAIAIGCFAVVERVETKLKARKREVQ